MSAIAVFESTGEWFHTQDIARIARPTSGEPRRVREARQAALRYVLNSVNMAFRKTPYGQPVILGLSLYNAEGEKEHEELITISNLHIRLEGEGGSPLLCIHRDALSIVQRMLELCESKNRLGKSIRLAHKLI